ncbi:MAG TPA: glycosyltransferase family 9 protein [Ramlibacter sp.]|nr:glycosyltransferase family 9 protein [Ramlibacter sp.]
MKRILVVATRQIGDVLLTTPLIRAAKARWPQARIDVLGFAGTLGMLRGNPDLAELIESPARLGWRGTVSLLRRLWRRYDLALVTQPGDRAHLMAWVAGRQRSGIIPEHGGSNWWKRALLTHVVVSAGDLGEVHVVAEKLALLRPWVAAEDRNEPVAVPPAAPLPAEIQSQLRAGFLVIHAPSMWPYKQWPMAHFRILARQLLARGLQVVLTGGGAQRDRDCVETLLDLAAAPQLLAVAGRLDFNQLVTLFNQAALYIGPDTSVSHLAAACGVPTLAIFGPTNPQRWAPWPNDKRESPVRWVRAAASQTVGNVTLLQGSPSCVPCGRAGCEDHLQSRSDCLVSITPQRVLDHALRILGG